MTNILDYFHNLYMNTNTITEWEGVSEYEFSIYEMEEGFEEWAEEHNIDLTAVSEYGITYVQHWRWGLED